MSVNIPPVSHYIVYHNVTSDGDQGIMVYDISVTINVNDDQFDEDTVYSIQVAAVNIIDQAQLEKPLYVRAILSFHLKLDFYVVSKW